MLNNAKRTAAIIVAAMLTAGCLAGCAENKSSQVSSAVQSSAVSQTSSIDSGEAAETDVYDYGKGLTEEGYFEGVTASDYVKLPDYNSIEIPEDVSVITDDELKSEIDSRLSSFTTSEQVTDRAIEDGDTVNIDYVGSVDGVEFDGGNTGGSGTTVTIGVTSYIDDFLEQLIGHKPGETFDVNVTFPNPYPNDESLSGKDAVFVTTINYIVEENTPELTDELVAENWKDTEGWATAEEAKAGIRAELREAAIAGYLWQEVQSGAEVSQIPENILQYHTDNTRNYYETTAAQYGMKTEDFLATYIGVESMDELLENNAETLRENAKNSLLLQAVSEEMGLKIEDKDIADFFEKNVGTSDYSDLESQYGKAYLRLFVRENIVKLKLAEGK